MHQSKCRELLLVGLVVIVSCVSASDNADCGTSDNPLACRSVNFLSKALNQVISNHDDTLKLFPGLEIVQNENINKVNNVNDERSMPEQQNETVFSRIAKYLQTHDLKIKFADMVGKSDLQEVVSAVFSNDDPSVVGEKRMNEQRVNTNVR